MTEVAKGPDSPLSADLQTAAGTLAAPLMRPEPDFSAAC
jgi:hypothetical protein